MSDLPRPIEIVVDIISAIISIGSRIVNAVFFGGSMHQTISARSHIEVKRGSVEWGRRRAFINRLFFWQADHCEQAWLGEVYRARRTIQLNSFN